MIEFDVETTGLQPHWHEMFLAQFHDGKETVVFKHPQEREKIQEWLSRDDDYRAWNTKFDLGFLKAAGYTLPPEDRWHDGMVLAHIMDANRSAALKARAEALFGQDERDLEKQVKSWLSQERRDRKKHSKETGEELVEPNYSDVPFDLMRDYAAQDVILTRRVCESYEPVLKRSEELRDVYELERNVLAALFAVEQRGIPFDRDAAYRFELGLVESLEGLESDAKKLAGIETFNPNSSKQIHEALKRRGADLTLVTGESMDAENLGTVDDDLARAILAFRGEYKNLTTYVRPLLNRSFVSSIRSYKEPFIAEDGRVHPNFRQVGARTGRMSASDPNVQNMPRDDLRLRYLVKAGEGKKLVACDLDSIELRLFAAYAGEGALLKAVHEGEDLHSLTARNAGLGDRKRQTGIETARQRGKTLNYSIIYGAGIRSLRKAFGVTQAEARQILARYHAAYPEVSRLQNRILWRLQDTGYVKSLWGRRFRSDRPDREGYRFTNYLVQGTAADLMKAALVRLHAEGVPVIACVHDEVLIECDEDYAQEAAQRVTAALTEHPLLDGKVPLDAEAKIIDRWSDAKDPEFVADYDTNRKEAAA